jgi:carbon-monoxide dehydrogenase medium subunit
VIPHPFRYHAPVSVDAAVALLREAAGDSVVLGGGTWVVPELGDPANRAAQVVDLRRAGLNEIVDHGDRVSVGAMVTYTDLLHSAVVRRALPLLVLVAEGVTGGPQIQSQGTIGGSACAARPASDVPAGLLALDAIATVHGPTGTRSVPVERLWPGPFRCTLAVDEVLTGFEIPVQRGCSAYRKLKRGTSSWPIVTVGAAATLDGTGLLTELTVAVGAAAAVPFGLPTGDLAGSAPSPALVDEIADRAREALAEPWTDELAPAEYRAGVLPVVVRRVVQEAFTRAQEAGRA